MIGPSAPVSVNSSFQPVTAIGVMRVLVVVSESFAPPSLPRVFCSTSHSRSTVAPWSVARFASSRMPTLNFVSDAGTSKGMRILWRSTPSLPLRRPVELGGGFENRIPVEVGVGDPGELAACRELEAVLDRDARRSRCVERRAARVEDSRGGLGDGECTRPVGSSVGGVVSLTTMQNVPLGAAKPVENATMSECVTANVKAYVIRPGFVLSGGAQGLRSSCA